MPHGAAEWLVPGGLWSLSQPRKRPLGDKGAVTSRAWVAELSQRHSLVCPRLSARGLLRAPRTWTQAFLLNGVVQSLHSERWSHSLHVPEWPKALSGQGPGTGSTAKWEPGCLLRQCLQQVPKPPSSLPPPTTPLACAGIAWGAQTHAGHPEMPSSWAAEPFRSLQVIVRCPQHPSEVCKMQTAGLLIGWVWVWA